MLTFEAQSGGKIRKPTIFNVSFFVFVFFRFLISFYQKKFSSLSALTYKPCLEQNCQNKIELERMRLEAVEKAAEERRKEKEDRERKREFERMKQLLEQLLQKH